MLRVRSKFFRQKKTTKLQSHIHVCSSWPIRVHFRWPCLHISRVWQGGSSDSCRLCQFLWDSAEQTAHKHVRPESGRWFPLVWCRHVFVSQNIKRLESFEEPVHWICQFIVFAIYLDSCNIIKNLCFDFFNVGEGVNRSGNRQNLRKTKWRPRCWNPRFGAFRCHTRTVTMLWSGLSPVTRNLCCQSALRNRESPQTDSLGLIDNTSFWWQGLIP